MKTKKGYTLIELLLALGIISIFAVIIFFTYAKVSDNMKYNSINDLLVEMKLELNQYYDNNFGSSVNYDNTSPFTLLNNANLNPRTIAEQDDNSITLKTSERLIPMAVDTDFAVALHPMNLRDRGSWCVNVATRALNSKFPYITIDGSDSFYSNDPDVISKVIKRCQKNPSMIAVVFYEGFYNN